MSKFLGLQQNMGLFDEIDYSDFLGSNL